jgi:hypothetical protein
MAEFYTGQVQNGVIVLDEGTPPLPEGTKVQVEAVDMEAEIRDLSRLLLSIAGKAKGLPSDFAEQHDHYIHGTPKR